jgi:hypothetical protein
VVTKRTEHGILQKLGTDPVPGVAGEVHREELDGLERRGGAGPDLADHQLYCQRTARQNVRGGNGHLSWHAKRGRPYTARRDAIEMADGQGGGDGGRERTRTWWEPMAM